MISDKAHSVGENNQLTKKEKLRVYRKIFGHKRDKFGFLSIVRKMQFNSMIFVLGKSDCITVIITNDIFQFLNQFLK